MKWRYALLTVGLSLAFIAACSVEEESKDKTKITDIPNVSIIVDDKEITPTLVAQSLNGEGEQTEADEGVEKVAQTIDSVVAEPNSLVQVYVEPDEQLEKVFVRLWENNTAKMVKTKNNQFVLPKQPGNYIYEVMTYYEHGDMQHAYKVTVE